MCDAGIRIYDSPFCAVSFYKVAVLRRRPCRREVPREAKRNGDGLLVGGRTSGALSTVPLGRDASKVSLRDGSLEEAIKRERRMIGSYKKSAHAMLTALSLVLLSLAGANCAKAADDYPNKPIEVIVGYLPGGATDFAARVLAESLSTSLGQPVIVNNRPGASSAIAVDAVKRADPDGYTLLFGNNDAIAILPAVKPDVAYKIPDDLTFISRVVEFPLVFAVSTKLPLNAMKDFVEYAKANPGKFNYGSSGVGGSLHIEGVRMALAAGIDITHVAYKGAAGAVTDLVGGQIDGMFGTVKDISAHLNTGTIKLLAVTSPERVPVVPDVPTLAEAGLGDATVTGWFALMGPANMPKEVTDKLSKAVADALVKPEVAKRLADSGLYTSPLAGAEFKDFVVKQLDTFKTIAEKQNIRITD
ncbi:MAG: tripartite tricarboxylate transporter substrate binding protein [Mesorhizobium sp.]|nr:tripartite tricarboxylate transporter substrate binding protein [Mesorhizobium sp. M7A.F.Ca.MR.362.00.0.0]RWN26833.1 MAG: tripartite tricarboxylate transporter substrate binding protein [Mesorhizobium sp.]RWN92270.1 MAG: tripartite tricarboxylate transporter substrate binding protein [Mesorhizobium sp.]